MNVLPLDIGKTELIVNVLPVYLDAIVVLEALLVSPVKYQTTPQGFLLSKIVPVRMDILTMVKMLNVDYVLELV